MTTPAQITAIHYDVVLVGAGIMSATLAAILKELQSDLKIAILRSWRAPRKRARMPGTTLGPAMPLFVT
jgi:glycine/D-amino acid oxidase-like deaminating enzyme